MARAVLMETEPSKRPAAVRSTFAALAVLLAVTLTPLPAHSTGYDFNIDTPASQERLAQLERLLELPPISEKSNVKLHEILDLGFLRIEQPDTCFRDLCLTYIFRGQAEKFKYIKLMSESRVHMSDEMMMYTPDVHGGIVFLRASRSGGTIRILLTPNDIVVVP